VVDRGDATIANQITNTYVRCISTELQVREQLELRERMELLEAEVEAAAAARGYGGDGSRPGMDYGA
jgi:predicted double-glycine peptidase